MSNKHKYYDVIVAWANGEKIQFNFAQSGWEDFTKAYITDIPGFDNYRTEWRIKPKTTVKRYRMALFTDGMVVAYDITNSTLDDPIEYKLCGFVRWVGDTVEVEIEV